MARKLAYDRLLFAAIVLLLGLGLVMVYSATSVLVRQRGLSFNSYFMTQLVAACLGLVGMFLAMHLDYRVLKRPAVIYAIVFAVIFLLVAVLFAPPVNNSRRWFFIGGVSVQPSELAKLALIPFVAYHVERKKDRLDSYAFFVPTCVAAILMTCLVVVGRDLGTAALLGAPALAMVFIAGISVRFLATAVAMLAPLIAVTILQVPYRLERLMGFLNPEANALTTNFQVNQSLIAVGSGGIFGLGPGHSVQKLYFLPSPHADFVFSIIAEELGFVGAASVITLLGVIFWRGAIAGYRAPDLFGRYLAWGFTAWIVLQSLVHISVAVALVPTTGIPLPLVSHGGSSMVTSLVACGLLLNVSQHR